MSMTYGRYYLVMAVLAISASMIATAASSNGDAVLKSGAVELSLGTNIMLPEPQIDGGILLDKALKERRSNRMLRNDSLAVETVSQLLWAAQGVTDDRGHRTAGSAWEAYPLEVYLLAGNITDLDAGVYRYRPQDHSLIQLSRGDARAGFVNSSVVPGNAWIKTAPAIFLITGNFEKAISKGADNSTVYVEAGLASENFLLEVVSLGLGCTYVGGFNSNSVSKFLNLSKEETPIALLPVGYKA